MENLQEVKIDNYLTFKLENEIFAVNVAKVLEILEVGHITKVPHAPEYMCGVINLRGNVLPVIDARIKFGMPAQKITVNTCIIVLNVTTDGAESIRVGILVDAVQEVLEIKEASINAMPSVGTRKRSEFIQGMVNREDNFLMVLDIDRVFIAEELSLIENAPEQDTEQDPFTETLS